MNEKLRDAAQAALLALKCLDGLECAREEIEALEAALAEPEQEPMHPEIKKMYEDYFDKCFRESSAQQRPWVGLTAKEIDEIEKVVIGFNSLSGWENEFGLAIEAKLREKNT